jgi:hypothetical protein
MPVIASGIVTSRYYQKVLFSGTAVAPLPLEARPTINNVRTPQYSRKVCIMATYKWGWFVFITESLLVALLLTFLGWQSWNARSPVDMGRKDIPSSVGEQS